MNCLRPAGRRGAIVRTSVDGASGPEQDETVIFGVDQRCKHGSRETGIVELDREVLAACARGPLPRGAELALAGEHPEIRGLVVLLSRGRDLGLDCDGDRFDCADIAVVRLGEFADDSHVHLLV